MAEGGGRWCCVSDDGLDGLVVEVRLAKVVS